MKLAFFTMPIHPVDKDWRISLREDREAFLLADELGFTEAYVGEHVTDRAENITSRVAFIAYRLARSRDQTDQAWHRHHQPAEYTSGRGCGLDRNARSHARRKTDLRRSRQIS